MKAVTILSTVLLSCAAFAADDTEFTPLFNGKNLDGWKANEAPETFSVADGILTVNGVRSHLFYDGAVQNHDFKNFHLRVELQTFPSANSGVYFHTEYQTEGWPKKGFEVQVNNTHKDPKKTAGLYAVQDNFTAPVEDNHWFLMEIIVEGKHVVTKVDGKVITDFTEPEPPAPPKNMDGRVISHGTIAIQGHDPGSKVQYKRIEIKPLP
ncbi:MAG: DUF1080 domain-containing protein [Verrucomicrobiota bacterium]